MPPVRPARSGRALHNGGLLVYYRFNEFCQPAVTLARSFTDSFSGIQLGDMPALC